jgi:hypothetical protein
MTDQILIMDKLRKWFWYYGVIPLVVAYVICLNFAAEFVNIVVIENRSITLYYMGELLYYTTVGIAFLMIIWCIINAIRVYIISSKITAPELKNKKYSFNTSVILCPFIAFFGFIPLALTLSATKMYFPLFPLIEPIAQNLTPYLFPIYLFIINASEYMFGNFSYSY